MISLYNLNVDVIVKILSLPQVLLFQILVQTVQDLPFVAGPFRRDQKRFRSVSGQPVNGDVRAEKA